MVVSKILETTLTAGQTSVAFTDTDIPNSLIRVFTSNPDIIPESRTLSGNTLTVVFAAQPNNIDVALEMVKAGLDIVDNVTSTDMDKALSANQGKVLKDAVDAVDAAVDALVIPENITDLDDVAVTSIQDGQVLAWDEDTNKFVNVTPASSGGFFIDTTNVIQSSTNIPANTDVEYTASQNCVIRYTLMVAGNNSISVKIDDVSVLGIYNSSQLSLMTYGSTIYLKAGQKITMRQSYTQTQGSYTVYGLC